METLLLQKGLFTNVGTQSASPSDSYSSSLDGGSTPGTSYGGSLANQMGNYDFTNFIPTNYGPNYISHLQFPENIPDMTYYSDALEVLKSNSNYVCDSQINTLDSILPGTQQNSNQANPPNCDNAPYSDEPISIPQEETYCDMNAQEFWPLQDRKQISVAAMGNKEQFKEQRMLDEIILKNLEDPTNAVIQAIALGQKLETPGTTELDAALDSLDIGDESKIEEVLKSYGDFDSETNVGRIVDKQLNSSNEITYDVAHCENINLDPNFLANILESDEINIHPVDFNIPNNVIEENHNVNKLNDDLIIPNDKSIEIKKNVDVKVNDANSVIKRKRNESKKQKVCATSYSDSESEQEDSTDEADEDYVPSDLENRTIVENPSPKRPNRRNNRNGLCKRTKLLRGNFLKESSQHGPKAPPKIQKAVVPVGRKKIDMDAQKYVFDEEIDIVTVAKDEEPIIEAGDVDSLLEQFEKSEYKKSNNSTKMNSNNKRSGTNLKSKRNELKGVVSAKERTSSELVKQSLRKINKSRSSQEKSNPEFKNKNKFLSKQELLKSHVRDEKKQEKKQASSYVPRQETQLKTPSTDKQSKEKVSSKSTGSEHRKTGAKSSSTDKTVGIPKELIGRIKNGNKQRTIVLLDDPFFLGGDPVFNKKKTIKKVKTTDSKEPVTASTNAEKSALSASSTKSSVATSNTLVKNSLPQGQMMKKPIVSSASSMHARPLNQLGAYNPSRLPSTRPISGCVPLKSKNSSGGAQKPVNNSGLPIDKSFKTHVRIQGTTLVSHNILRNNQPQVADKTQHKQESPTLQHVFLDHSYSKAFPEETDEKQKLTDKPQKQTIEPQKQTNLRLMPSVDASINTNSKISPDSISNKESNIEESKTTSKEVEENPKSGTVPKKVWNFEEYKKRKGICRVKTSLDNKKKEPEDYAKKLEIITRVPVPDHLDCIETYDVSVDACLADENGIKHLAELTPVIKEVQPMLTKNSFYNSYKDALRNKPDDILNQEKVERSGLFLRYAEKNRVKPTMCTQETQTFISLIQRSSSYSSDSSSDSEYSEYSTSSSRHSRSTKRSRYSSSRYGRSRSRSYSPQYRSNDEEYEEYKDDAVNRRILFLGELPSDIDKRRLRRTLETYGEIKSVKIHRKKNPSKRMKSNSGRTSQIYAFVTFYSSSSAFKAMTCYKKDYPEAENYLISFGGRREFCNQSYEDLDNMPSNYACERYSNNEESDYNTMLLKFASDIGININLRKGSSR